METTITIPNKKNLTTDATVNLLAEGLSTVTSRHKFDKPIVSKVGDSTICFNTETRRGFTLTGTVQTNLREINCSVFLSDNNPFKDMLSGELETELIARFG